MSHGDQKSSINQQEKEDMLNDLESLSRMLEERAGEQDEATVVPEDIPVLKSFVDEVPVLSETMEDPEPASTEDHSGEPPTLQPTDSLDRSAPRFDTAPLQPAAAADHMDISFLDRDPLDISERVRQYRRPGATASPAPAPRAEATLPPEPPARPQPSAAEVTRPLNRFQASGSTENPFLPRSTLDKIRENHAWEQRGETDNDASAQLRKLLQDNPLNKVSFDNHNSSRELQTLRRKASQLVDEVVRASLPRLEAELRMKLEQEVDRMFKEIRKNPR